MLRNFLKYFFIIISFVLMCVSLILAESTARVSSYESDSSDLLGSGYVLYGFPIVVLAFILVSVFYWIYIDNGEKKYDVLLFISLFLGIGLIVLANGLNPRIEERGINHLIFLLVFCVMNKF